MHILQSCNNNAFTFCCDLSGHLLLYFVSSDTSPLINYKYQFCVKVYIIYFKFLSERVLVEFNWSKIINYISIMCQGKHNLFLILLMCALAVPLNVIKRQFCNVIISFKPGQFSPFGHLLLEVSNLLLGLRSWSIAHVIKDGIISQSNCWLCKGFHR